MLKKLILITFILYSSFFSISIFAFDFDKGLLWQIEAPNGEKNQLFGTMHLVDKDTDTIFNLISNHVKKARTVFIEYTLDESDSSFILNNLINTHTAIKTRLSTKEILKLEKFMRESGIAFDQLQNASPFLIHSYLINPGSISNLQLDFKIADLANQQGIPTKGLENSHAVFERFLTFDDSFYTFAIKKILFNINILSLYRKKLKTLYFKEDLNSILSSLNEKGIDEQLNKDFVYSLINERNINMFNSVRTELDKGKVFMAVGAAHLGGQKGLLNLFKNAGYKITRQDLGLQ